MLKNTRHKHTWHLAIWVIYLFYQCLEFDFSKNFHFPSVALLISYVFTAISTFYLFYLVIWKRFLNQPNLFLLVLGIVFGLLFFICFRYFLEEVIFEALLGFGNYYDDSFTPYFFDNISRAIFYAAFSLVVFLLEKKETMERKMLELKNEKAEAELAFLRSQLNPHFLFNTLSFLHTKTIKYDPELSDTIRKLSDMLRYSLQSSKEKQVSIQKEIELVENYIDIFRNRFEGRFFVDLDIPKTNLPFKIEPLILIPFVENMFKHGIMSNPETPGEIALKYEENHLTFKCHNKINRHKKDASSGIGLENIERRLKLLYPNSHTLTITEENDYFTTILELKLN